MNQSDKLKLAIKKVIDGGRDEADIRTISSAIKSGRLKLVADNKAIATYGNISDSSIITGSQNVFGDNNSVIYGPDAEVIKAIFIDVLGDVPFVSQKKNERDTFPINETPNLKVGIKHDWGDAPDVPAFFGRHEELLILEQWMINDHCRLVAIVGMGGIGKTGLSSSLRMGGIGKTDLSLVLARKIQNEFEYIVWKSLRTAPPIGNILEEWIKFLSNQKDTKRSSNIDESISQLLFYLRERRCLLILDNVEKVLKGGDRVGQCQEGYEDYGELFKKVGETPHQSCLLLTSREIPQEIALREGERRSVRILKLAGLDKESVQKIFSEIGSFSGSDSEWKRITKFYDGNPLALEIVAKYINRILHGNLLEFINEHTTVFSDIRELLDWHFERFSNYEKEIMYWLSINQNPVSNSDLMEDILLSDSKKKVADTMQSLDQRLPLERSNIRFTLQPVLMEYIIDRLIDEVFDEISTEKIRLLKSHALIKAQAADYIRKTQIRLIIEPLIEKFDYSDQDIENKLTRILEALPRSCRRPKPTYAGGNIINLCLYLDMDLNGYDFSGISIWQAYLQGYKLYNVNFSYSDLSRSVFSQTFGSALSVTFSPDGKLLAMGDDNGSESKIYLWEVSRWQLVRFFEGHVEWVRSISFSYDGQMIASASDDKTVRIWNTSNGSCLKVLEGHTNWVRSVIFGVENKTIASASDDMTIRVWNIFTGKCQRIIKGHTGWVRSITFSPDGHILASGSGDCTIKLWDMRTGKCLKVLKGHSEGVQSVSFNHDGTKIASGSQDKTIRVWDLEKNECMILSGHTGWVRSVAFNPVVGSTNLASAGEDRSLRIWDIRDGSCQQILGVHTNWVRQVVFSSDGKLLASGSDDQTIRIWMTRNNKWEEREDQCLRTLQGYTNWVTSVSYHADSDRIISGSHDNLLRIWKVSDDKDHQVISGHDNWILSIDYCPKSEIIASGSQDKTIKIWNITDGQCIQTLQGHADRVWSVVFNPIDSNILASGSEDETVKVWNIETGQCICTLSNCTNRRWTVDFSPNGQMLASGGDDHEICLWDWANNILLKTLPSYKRVWAMAFSPLGKRLASCNDDGTVFIWNINDYSQHVLSGHSNRARAVAFSSDGNKIASGGEDNTIKIWDSNNNICLKTLKGHNNWIRSIDFSPDGQKLVSGSQDGTIKIWDISSGKCLRKFILPKPYNGMNITDIKGLTNTQKDTLKKLGAIEVSSTKIADTNN